MQHLEARAFGCLPGEFARPAEPPPAVQLLAALRDWQRRCQQLTGAARSLFAEIEHELAAFRGASEAA